MGRGIVSALPWLVGAAIVVAGWLSGYETWEQPSLDGDRTYFDVFVPALTLVCLPLCLLAGVLVGYWASIATQLRRARPA